MARKSEQVLIRITPERKEEWEAVAEEHGYSTSEFVRFAVDNWIQGQTAGNEATATVDPESVADAVEDVIQEHTETVTERLSAIEAAVSGVQEEVGTGGQGTVAAELIFEGLPNILHFRKNVDEVAADAKTAEEVAADIGVPAPPVRRTLERLDLESERVHSVEFDNGERGYFTDV
jgi:hypothetical protein